MKERLSLYFFRPTSAVLLDNQHASILEGDAWEICFSDSEEESSCGQTHDDDYVIPNTSSVTKPAKGYWMN